MVFLSDNLEGLFVPRGTRNPGFRYTIGFGPTLVRHAFVQCISQNPHEIRAALPWGDVVVEHPFDDDQTDQREIIYLAYDEARRWIFVFDITEDLGLLFSDCEPHSLISGVDLEGADEQFAEVCSKWVAKHNSQHASAIQKWLDIRNSGNGIRIGER